MLLGAVQRAISNAAQAYTIDNSVIYNDDDSPYLTRTPSSAGNRTTWTFSCWLKRGNFTGSSQFILTAGTGTGDYTGILISSDQLRYIHRDSSSITDDVVGTMLLRDVAAWYHIVCAVDTTQGTAADRVRLYVNGIEITDFDTSNYPASSANTDVNNTVDHYIGANAVGSNAIDGALSGVYLIDGQQLTPSSFGEFDSNGVWVPKEYTGSYGTNGVHPDFADSADLGNDVSGNANDFTSSGLTSSDQTTDTPTNNYCVMNHLVPGGNAGYAEGNLQVSPSADSSHGSFLLPQEGKWYWEVTVGSVGGTMNIGVIDDTYQSADGSWGSQAVTYRSNGDKYNGTPTSYGATYGAADVIGIELDLDSGTIEFYKNGSSQGVAYSSGLTGRNFKPFIADSGSGSVTFEFGAKGFTYTPSAGFNALCTANLPAVDVPDPSTEFVVVTDTESNIESTLAAARSGWSNYVDIFKNRDTSESSYVRLSTDSSNCFNMDSTDARESFPTLSGADAFLGISMKLNGNGNIKAGSVSHTNGGGDTTVTHNAGNSRCLIILFPQGGGTRPVYHPELTAGKLLYLDTEGDEATDSFIKNVTANAFDIDSAEATDTYWYIVIPETEGFYKLGVYDGNSNSDGPFAYTGLRIAHLFIKRIGVSNGNWHAYDKERNPHNVTNLQFYLSKPDAEVAGGNNSIDSNANGFKPRDTGTGINNNNSFVFGAFADHPFGGSNVAPAPAR